MLRARSPGVPRCANTLRSVLAVSFGGGHEPAEEQSLDVSRPVSARNGDRTPYLK